MLSKGWEMYRSFCTDKSGTLTQNQMTVREVWVSRRKLKVTGVGYEPKGQFMPSPGGLAIRKRPAQAAGSRYLL